MKSNLKSTGVRLGWSIVVVWFSANVLSQMIYMRFHGMPYDASALLSSLGGWYWALLFIELAIWVLFGALVAGRIKTRIAVRQQRLDNMSTPTQLAPIKRPTIGDHS
ncbi:MAG: hypothetical protein VX320_03925 [Candidatus Thermoplasmatota archaeon]|nr:hypothetical protein [Candidatus Thermoplasmatota archaeon]